ncbi:MAG: class I SAM-dependent methyltransferase [Chloroflexi bacterium]|nr:class I SAM-dependent methyltransferase [Chloroflexota bacterium]
MADVGCGTGLITRRLIAEKVVGLDINRWNLHRAVGHVATLRPVQGDAERLPLRPHCFDLMVCTETLEHLVEPRRALQDMLLGLKPGGKLIGSMPSRSWVWKMRRYVLSTCPGSEPFHNQFSLDEARDLLRLPGCTVLELYSGILGLSILFVLQKDPASPSV